MGKCVLIIEDEREIRETLGQLLELEGYSVVYATNGEEGLRQLQQMPRRPCLILLDILMPVMNGWKFLEARRALGTPFTTVPVAVISGIAERPKDLGGAAAFFRKPLNFDLLIRFLEEQCRGPEAACG